MRDKAVCFQKGNVGDLRDKLKVLLDEKEKVEDYKKDASDFVCKKYSWDDAVEQIIKLYQ